MILLTSAAYLDQEFSSEFGRIPPAFLPVGNQRLYHHQVRALPTEERIVLTIPDTYTVSEGDAQSLERLGVEVLEIPEGLSLGESVVCAIILSGHTAGERLRILHGDTLIQNLSADEPDAIGLSEVDGNYNWAVYTGDPERLLRPLDDTRLARGPVRIANGYFSFADAGLLVRCITKKRGNFIEGISLYSHERRLQPVTMTSWLDFGHIHTFYRSKSQITTQRAFNEMNINPQTVTKTSDNTTKMSAEARWFQTIPDELKVYTPAFIREIDEPDRRGYELEYLYRTALNELFVFGSLPRFVWRRIFSSCLGFLDICRRHDSGSTGDRAADIFLQKTLRRLQRFQDENRIDLDAGWTINGHATPGLADVARHCAQIIDAIDCPPACVSHGDFCFSNILFDFRSQAIKVIDPRGLDADDELTIYGSALYDIAKLSHSAVGYYDFIIAGYFDLSGEGHDLGLRITCGQSVRDIQSLFLELCHQRFGLGERELLAMQVHLFLSMLPLHADDRRRQTALLANALRLYSKIPDPA